MGGLDLKAVTVAGNGSQFFDVYFQHSAGTRPALIQKGLNQTIAELPEDVRKRLDLKPVEVSGDVGRMTRGALITLIENGYGDKVRANVAKQRDAHFGGKPTGNNQVRIESTR